MAEANLASVGSQLHTRVDVSQGLTSAADEVGMGEDEPHNGKISKSSSERVDSSDLEAIHICQQRRGAASNVFYQHETLAIDYAIESHKPKKWYKRKLQQWKSTSKDHTDMPSICDLEVVKLHLPHLLDRRNASDNIVKVTPELVKENYEALTQTSVKTSRSQ